MKKAVLLRSKFEIVRERYFPRWDIKRRWRVRRPRPDWHGHGLCDWKSRRIFVAWDYGPAEPETTGVIIHEICHAVTPASGRHAKKWQNRMLLAADEADSIGEGDLAAWLRKDVALYRDGNPEHVTPQAVYSTIEDIVTESKSVPVLAKITKRLAAENLMTLPEFKKAFPRFRKVYAETMEYRNACLNVPPL